MNFNLNHPELSREDAVFYCNVGTKRGVSDDVIESQIHPKLAESKLFWIGKTAYGCDGSILCGALPIFAMRNDLIMLGIYKKSSFDARISTETIND